MVDSLKPLTPYTSFTLEFIYPASDRPDSTHRSEDGAVDGYQAIRFTVQIKTEEARQMLEPLRRAAGMLLRFSEEGSNGPPEDLIFKVSYLQPPKKGA